MCRSRDAIRHGDDRSIGIGLVLPDHVLRLYIAMVQVIERFEGAIDKFIGDGIMIFCGLRLPPEGRDSEIYRSHK